MIRIHVFPAIFFVLLVNAQEGNYRYESYGNQSLLLNGNVTGSAEDLGLTYYNPARLAFISEPSIVLAGKAFQLLNFDLEDVLGSEIDLNDSNFNGIPSIFSGTFKIKKLENHQFAYSFISRYRTNIDLSYNSGIQIGLPSGNMEVFDQSFTDISFVNKLKDEWYGISWAYKLKDNFSIGATLFGSIYEINGRGNILVVGEGENGQVVNYTSQIDFDQKTYGIFLKIGAAWQLEKASLGINFTTPFMSFKDKSSLETEEFLSGLGQAEDFFRVIDLDDLEGKRRTATNIAIGAGIPMGKSVLHLSADWTAGIGEYDRIELPEIPASIRLEQSTFRDEYKSVLNFGAGADLYVSPSVRLLVSFSSDFSATESSLTLFDVVNQSEESLTVFGDFWHFGLGPDLSFKWGKITLGTTYSRSTFDVEDAPEIPGMEDDMAVPFTTAVGVERWRFVVGFEIPLISDTIKKLPIR